MSDDAELLTASRNGHDLVAVLAEQAMGPHPLVSGRQGPKGNSDLQLWTLRDDQRLELVDLEQYAPVPTRKRGLVQLRTAEALFGYAKRHADEHATTLWSDLSTAQVEAVFNDHTSEQDAGWGDHRAVLALVSTADWDHWLRRDGQLLAQEQFAEHIEDGADAVTSPDAATMLEIAQSFHAKRGVNFRSGKQLASGEVQFLYEETLNAKAGQRGEIGVPALFQLTLQPFEGGAAYQLFARFRYRIDAEGGLRLGYRLIRPDKVREQAFDGVCDQLGEWLGLPILAGRARSESANAMRVDIGRARPVC